MAEFDVYQVNVNALLAGKEIANTFYYYESPGIVYPQEGIQRAINQQFYDDLVVPQWLPLLSRDYRLSAIWTRRVYPTVTQASTTVFSGDTGSVSSDAVPNGSSVLFSGRAAIKSRNFRRRIYFGGLPEEHSAHSEVTIPALFQWQSFASTIVNQVLSPAELAPAQYFSCAYSPLLAIEIGTDPFSRLTSMTANGPIRSQRGRNLRRA